MAFRTRTAPVGSPTGIGLRVILTLLGALGLIVSAFLPWLDGVGGLELPLRALIETTFTETSSTFTTVGFAAIVLGLLAVVGLAARFGGLTRAAGALGIVMVILFAIQVYRETGSVEMREGAWVALGGAIVAVIGGFMGWGTPVATQTVETVETVD